MLRLDSEEWRVGRPRSARDLSFLDELDDETPAPALWADVLVAAGIALFLWALAGWLLTS
jgi:hypothetical protein